jgi:hypothetical protein
VRQIEVTDFLIFPLDLYWQISEKLTSGIKNRRTSFAGAENLFEIIDFMDCIVLQARLTIIALVLTVGQIEQAPFFLAFLDQS